MRCCDNRHDRPTLHASQDRAGVTGLYTSHQVALSQLAPETLTRNRNWPRKHQKALALGISKKPRSHTPGTGSLQAAPLAGLLFIRGGAAAGTATLRMQRGASGFRREDRSECLRRRLCGRVLSAGRVRAWAPRHVGSTCVDKLTGPMGAVGSSLKR